MIRKELSFNEESRGGDDHLDARHPALAAWENQLGRSHRVYQGASIAGLRVLWYDRDREWGAGLSATTGVLVTSPAFPWVGTAED